MKGGEGIYIKFLKKCDQCRLVVLAQELLPFFPQRIIGKSVFFFFFQLSQLERVDANVGEKLQTLLNMLQCTGQNNTITTANTQTQTQGHTKQRTVWHEI